MIAGFHAELDVKLKLKLNCVRDLEINPMTLKLEGGLEILKMYLHTESEAASFKIRN